MGIVEDVYAALDLREPDDDGCEHVTYSRPLTRLEIIKPRNDYLDAEIARRERRAIIAACNIAGDPITDWGA